LTIASILIFAAAVILVRPTASATTHSGMQIYRAERAAITVTLKRHGRYLSRVRVAALGRCTDGRRTTISFAIIGGPGIRITRGGRFNLTRYNAHELRVLKGRAEDDAIRGYFRAFYDSGAETGFERCGTAVPNGRPIHFTARRVT
jgi:hypothetical protein